MLESLPMPRLLRYVGLVLIGIGAVGLTVLLIVASAAFDAGQAYVLDRILFF